MLKTVNNNYSDDESSFGDHSGAEDDFMNVTLELHDDHQNEEISISNDKDSQKSINGSSPTSPTTSEKVNFLLPSIKQGDGEDVPRISITPMTPPSISCSSPDGHDTVSLNSSGGSPIFQSQKYRGKMGVSPNLYWRPQSPMPPKNEFEAKEFFAYRDSIVNAVLEETQNLVESETDGAVRGTWLLTEIDYWDNEKERIVLLCDKSIIIVKYDFIGMKQEEHRRIQLCIIDKIIEGELKYPEKSLAPRLSGIAGGLVGVVKDCIIPKVADTVQTVGNVVLPKSVTGKNPNDVTTDEVEECMEQSSSTGTGGGGDIRSPKTSLMSALALENFEPRTRNVRGLRITWNQDTPLTFTQKWNPFNKSIPWVTFASHPLLWHKTGGGSGPGNESNGSFDIESFSRELIDVLSIGTSSGAGGTHAHASSPTVRIEYKNILIETYFGIASLFHNANSLGFYKVRGKVSF